MFAKTVPTISIMIAEDHQIYREGLLNRINAEPDFKLLGTFEDGRDLVKACQNEQPDVILMDVKMPVLDGIEATKTILASFPEVKIIALTMFDDEATILDMLRAGARGYLLKNADYSEFKRIIVEVFEGNRSYCKQVNHKIADILLQENLYNSLNKKEELSPKEIELLILVCKGFTAKEIAKIQKRPYRTVEGARDRLFNRINAHNAQAALVYALKHGIVRIEEL